MSLFKVIEPTESINLLPNPAARFGLTDFYTSGTNTIAQDATEQFVGPFSIKCTYQDTLGLIWSPSSGTPLTLVASTKYWFAAHIWVPSNWDGGDIRLGPDQFVSATITNTRFWDAGASPFDQWFWIVSEVDLDTDNTGFWRVRVDSAPTAGRFIYVDAAMVEQNDTNYTTYFDGDTQNCIWLGEPHASASKRPLTARGGGVVRDFVDDLLIYPRGFVGGGMPPIINHRIEVAGQDGAIPQNTFVAPRVANIPARITGSSLTNLHANRKSLIDLIKPDKVPGGGPTRFEYHGGDANNPLYMDARYESGLELGMLEGFSDDLPGGLRLVADNPYLFEYGQGGADITARLSLSLDHVAIRNTDFVWENANGGFGFYGFRIAGSPQNTFFATWAPGGSTPVAGHIGEYDGSTWSGLSTGLSTQARQLGFDINGDLIAVGAFSTPYNGIARWNGTSWSGFSTSSGDDVWDLAVDRTTGDIYVCGDFTTIGGVSATRVAKWNGTAWSAIGSTLGDICRTLRFNNDFTKLYVGGDFTGGLAAYDMQAATWESPVGTGVSGGQAKVYSLAFAPNGDLYLGGNFTTASGSTCNSIAKFTGKAYEPLGEGIGVGGTAFATAMVFGPDGNLYVGGIFTQIGGFTVENGIAIWTGTDWLPLHMDLPGNGWVWGLDFARDGRFGIAGDFTGTGILGNTLTLTNEGSAKTYPVFEMAGPATIRYFINHTTGASISLKLELPLSDTNDRARLDLRPGKRAFKRIYTEYEEDNPKNNLFWLLARPSELTKFYLAPGNNIIEIFVDNASAEIVAYWDKRHWGVDGNA